MWIERWNDLMLEGGWYENYRYVVIRNNMGYRCGYIEVDRSHPWYGKSRDELDFICVHGGVTFSDFDEDSSWFGFDCAHFNDAPDLELLPNAGGFTLFYGEIRSTDYVSDQCRLLILQAIEARDGIGQPFHLN
jgi:hypothetical protein